MKIAVVTGASSGLGREFTRQIAKRYRTIDEIWVIARRKDRLCSLCDEIKDVKLVPIDMDITDSDRLLMYKNMLEEKKPFVKLLVNAAGYGKIGHFDELPEAENTGMCELNCTALTRITAITLPYMKGSHADIINLASSAAFMPQPSFAVYAATKSYVKSLSLALDRELSSCGVSVTAVCPGPVSTEFFDVAETYHQSAFYKRLLRAKPDKVVNKALTDVYHGKKVSVYGVSMNLFYIAAKLLPHGMLVKLLK